MTYMMLYIAVLIAAVAGVGVIVARMPKTSERLGGSQEEGFHDFSAFEPTPGGLDAHSQFVYGIDHGD